MDIEVLDQSVDFYFRNGIAGSTQKSYNSAKRRYSRFCVENNFPPLPTSEHLLCRFVSALANENLCHNTIKCYLSGVRHLHIAEGFGDPSICGMAKLEQVLKGIKSTQAKGVKKPTRMPITTELLLKLKGIWVQGDGQDRDGCMLWAAAALCFFAFLRAGEMTVPSDTAFDDRAHLSFQDVAADSLKNPRTLKVRIKASKTDPFRVGVDVYVGRTDNTLAAVLTYMAGRGPGPGPLFTFRDGKPLTRARFVTQVRQALAAAGVDPKNHSGHSFRSGAATTAAKQGINDATIKMLGRWKSNAYQLYIQTPKEQLAEFSRRLV